MKAFKLEVGFASGALHFFSPCFVYFKEVFYHREKGANHSDLWFQNI